MHRRHFIQLSGSALAGLFLTQRTDAAASANIQLPSKLFITLDDGVHELLPGAHQNWHYKDALVSLRYINGGIHISLYSPTQPVSNVLLQWKYAVKQQSLLLGDHWERSYGDLHFQLPDIKRKMPWYFVQHDGNSSSCFGVKTGCASICHWQVGDGQMQLTLDTRNGGSGVKLGQRTLHAATIVATGSRAGENVFAVSRRFCRLMCDKPLLPKQPVYGINDWYITYGNNSAAIILDHTSRMAELARDNDNRPFSVVDSGWAWYSPLLPNDCCWQDDYSRPNDHFKDMAMLATNIQQRSMRAGLWTRPLCAAHNDKPNLLLPSIPGRTSPKKPVLDPSIEENIDRIKKNISLYHNWGYELVKHDFTTYDMLGKWGSHMNEDITSAGWHFNDTSKTTAEIILQLYRAIREAAGNMYLLGCNTMSHLSAGLFELNRIGDDTSGKEWERTRVMGVNTLGFRMTQHNTFYSADGDCVGLTADVPWEKNKQWMQLLAESSTPLFISAQEKATGNEQKEYIRRSFSMAAKKLPVAEPLDWMEKMRPERWKLNGKIKSFTWD
jgi:alpha-galactosidase